MAPAMTSKQTEAALRKRVKTFPAQVQALFAERESLPAGPGPRRDALTVALYELGYGLMYDIMTDTYWPVLITDVNRDMVEPMRLKAKTPMPPMRLSLKPDPAAINAVINDPTVRPFIGGLEVEGPLKIEPVLADPRTIVLWGDDGGFVVVPAERAGWYDLHAQFLPAGRGEQAIHGTQEMLDYLFTQTDCVGVTANIDPANLAAVGLARAGHLVRQPHKSTVGRDHWTLTKARWGLRPWRKE